MNARPGPVDPADAAAARWFVRLENERTPACVEEFERWRGADPRHAAAYTRIAATHSALGQLAQLKHRPEVAQLARTAEASRARRRALRFPVLLALAAAAVIAVYLYLPGSRGDRPAAARNVENYAAAGQARRVSLPDGSSVELNAGTRIRTAFSARERHVDLLSGEAHFDVAKNPARPFVVSAAGVAVRAVGTAFNVRMAESAVDVLVTEGRVQVGPAEAIASSTTPALAEPPANISALEAGQRVVVGTGIGHPPSPIETIDRAAIAQALAWQTSVLVLAETPLRDVVQQFNRRNRLQLEIADPEIGARRLGGNIRVDNPETFVRVLETGGDIVGDRATPGKIVLRRTR